MRSPIAVGEPVWLNARTLAFLVEACRRDHRVPLVDLDEEVSDRILVAQVRPWEGGERHLGRLGGSLFGVIERTREAGRGRVVLGIVAAMVFWELNGLRPVVRPGTLYNTVRRALGRRSQVDRLAQLVEVRSWARPP